MTTTATRTPFVPSSSVRRQTFGQTVHAEWIKFWTVRSTAWTLIATVGLMVGISALAAWGSSIEAVDAGDGPMNTAMLLGAGYQVGQLPVAVLGVLEAEGVPTRVVSMPCQEWFDSQPHAYRASVLPSGTARVAVGAGAGAGAGAGVGVGKGWRDYVGDTGEIVSVDHFGESAAGPRLFAKYGLTAVNVADRAKVALARQR
ncbi:MAG: hypothetical protein H5T82_09950 [Demequina sp.]|nr:hypothetical protein [Demequina sp.]